jgi:nucleoside-diphosphate-sugar epimerase
MKSKTVGDRYSDKTVLITGGAGCIGSNLTRTLIGHSAKRIVILDDFSASYEWNVPKSKSVTVIKGSILDEQKLSKAFSFKPDYVFHLAAHFANQNSVDHPEADLAVNGQGTYKVLERSRQAKVERVVYASSGCSVYGSNAPLPLKEDFVSLHLDTPYQINKLVGELYCNYFQDYYGYPVAIARYFNVYGPGEVPGRYRNVIPNFMLWAMNGKPLPVMGTGKETRDFTFVEDIVEGNLRMGVTPGAAGEAINLASGVETRVIDLANQINELTGNKAGIEYKKKRDWDKSNRRRASIEKARRILGYDPSTKFSDGLSAVKRWFQHNWKDIESSASF